jgi:hypothetical protein
MTKRLRERSSYGKQSDFRAQCLPNIAKILAIGAVAGVVDTAALMFEYKSSEAPMVIVELASAPMLAWR